MGSHAVAADRRSNQQIMAIRNQLAEVRKARGIGAAQLAKHAGISRQTIYAIEAGSYIPNTEVTLKLARVLEVEVEALFSLPDERPVNPERIATEYLKSAEDTAPVRGQAVRVANLGEKWVSVPVSATPYYLPEADGVLAGSLRKKNPEVVVFSADEPYAKRLLLAGCDPATNLLARMVERDAGVEIVSAAAASRLALEWLREGKVHIAGSHLEDPATGEFNIPYLEREFPEEDFTVVTFARWEEGLVTAPGNPKRIEKVEHLARRGVKFINREPGSGSRGLLDKLLDQAGIKTAGVAGYRRIAYGHLAAAYAVHSGDADCCLATRSAAQTFDLHFTPLHTERYDLVLRRESLELPAVQSFLDVLQRAALRRKLEILAGYDTAQTGTVLH